ncbi:monovalent cation/H+ antiporter complex subunit F [Segeticoccus rhizosphaerae]|uniref:monovalent cation/H+ antiporter complex subunit F n=1 Tax=Segeticoccus rhizosphaerae TaxID=1104777 RepID=UPI0010C14E00|nr:monovalent cation/H+ antiporter complex subunit F [Ornithinicoccus soli]
MTLVAVIAGALLAVSSAIALVRIVRGPSVLDRAVASEVIVSIVVCAIGLEAATTRHAAVLPILVSLSLVGFIGSVSVARFVARDRDDPPPQDPGRPPGGRGQR